MKEPFIWWRKMTNIIIPTEATELGQAIGDLAITVIRIEDLGLGIVLVIAGVGCILVAGMLRKML